MAKIEIDCCNNESSMKVILSKPSYCGDSADSKNLIPIYHENIGKSYILTIPNCLTENERKGFLAEQKFAEFLDNNNIPYLYIGQLASSLSYSQTFKESGVRRPDFLICHPDYGNLLIDVKARTRNSDNFYIYDTEYSGLLKAQESVKTPVWVAFVDIQLLIEDVRPEFYFIPLSKIERYYHTNYVMHNATDIINISESIMMLGKEFYPFEAGT